MIKSLIGAIVGVALGTAFVTALGMAGVSSLWPAIFVGIISGVAMRRITQGSGGNVYLRGGLSAVAVIAAVIAGNLVVAATLSRVESFPSSRAPTPPGEEIADADDAAAADGVESPLPAPVNFEAPPQPSNFGGGPGGGDFSVWDGIWMAVGALVAYELGRGESLKSLAGSSAGAGGEEGSAEPADDGGPAAN